MPTYDSKTNNFLSLLTNPDSNYILYFCALSCFTKALVLRDVNCPSRHLIRHFPVPVLPSRYTTGDRRFFSLSVISHLSPLSPVVYLKIAILQLQYGLYVTGRPAGDRFNIQYLFNRLY
jgi:hypothetical protein